MPISDSEIASIRTFYDAVLTANTELVKDFVDWGRLTIREPESLPFGGEHKGREGFLKLVRSIAGYFKDVRFEDIQICAGENMAITFMTMHVVIRATGQSLSFPVTEVFFLKGGKIVHIQPHYWDTHAILQNLKAN